MVTVSVVSFLLFALTIIVMAISSPGATLPMITEAEWIALLGMPFVVLTLSTSIKSGNGSVKIASFAGAVPIFVTLIVNVNRPPTFAWNGDTVIESLGLEVIVPVAVQVGVGGVPVAVGVPVKVGVGGVPVEVGVEVEGVPEAVGVIVDEGVGVKVAVGVGVSDGN